jgi:hypothetical protein
MTDGRATEGDGEQAREARCRELEAEMLERSITWMRFLAAISPTQCKVRQAQHQSPGRSAQL